MSSDSKNIESANNTENLQDNKETISLKIENNISHEDAENSKFMAVIKALIANLGIALVKFICFLFSSIPPNIVRKFRRAVLLTTTDCSLILGASAKCRQKSNQEKSGKRHQQRRCNRPLIERNAKQRSRTEKLTNQTDNHNDNKKSDCVAQYINRHITFLMLMEAGFTFYNNQ